MTLHFSFQDLPVLEILQIKIQTFPGYVGNMINENYPSLHHTQDSNKRNQQWYDVAGILVQSKYP